MKKGLILGIIIAIVAAGSGFGAYEFAMAKGHDNINNSTSQLMESQNQINTTNKTSNVSKNATKNVQPKIVDPQPPKALLTQGTKGVTTINSEKFATLSVGSGENETTAIMPNAGETLKVDKTFTKAVSGVNNTIGTGNAVFNATYNGTSGWNISLNGTSYAKASKYTTEYVPKVIEMSSTTGYIYAPASSATNQGFLIGYNLSHTKKFSWIVSINYQNTSLPRKNALGLGNLMLSGNYGLYATNTGAIYTFNDTYTMLIQNKEYPSMRFIFNTGSLNNLEPLQNMGYFNDSFVKSPKMNNNIPVICPITSSTGYVYQKPTADAKGYIWFFNTNWNKGYSLNANGIAIPAGNYNMPSYDSSTGTVNVVASGSIAGVTATPATDFNGPQTNIATSDKSGTQSLGIEVKDASGALLAGQAFNVTNSSGKVVASNVQSNSNGIVWLYGLPQDTYTITSVSNPSFTVSETVINGETAPVANLVYDGTTLNAPENLNPTSGTITIDLSNYPDCNSVNLYQDGQFISNYTANSDDEVVIPNVNNGLYTVATVIGGYVTSAQVEQALNSANESASTSFREVQNLTTGNIYAQSNSGTVGEQFTLLDSNGNVEDSGVTDNSGTVEFSNIPFGTYTIENSSNSQQITISSNNYTSWAYFS
ncbi:MAG: MSCRAMM family protein [Sarcina sp.]